MSVTLAKSTDHDDREPQNVAVSHRIDDAEPWFVTVSQLPDGRVSSVEIGDFPPATDELFPREPHATVWTAPLPEYEGDTANAIKVLDLALSNTYRDDDGHGWSEGERAERAFHNDMTGERAFLRNVEARIIRAGYLDVHTGMVSCRDYGLTVGDPDSEQHLIMRWTNGWKWAAVDRGDISGWHEQPGYIAPADASPRQVAAAIITNLACFDLVDYEHLPLRYRAHVWRVTFSLRYRIAGAFRRINVRITRARRRITVRIPR